MNTARRFISIALSSQEAEILKLALLGIQTQWSFDTFQYDQMNRMLRRLNPGAFRIYLGDCELLISVLAGGLCVGRFNDVTNNDPTRVIILIDRIVDRLVGQVSR